MKPATSTYEVLRDGLAQMPNADPKVRQDIEAVAKEVHEQRQERIQSEHNKSLPEDPFALSKADEAFVAEHAKASNLSEDSVRQTLSALRDWENTSGKPT